MFSIADLNSLYTLKPLIAATTVPIAAATPVITEIGIFFITLPKNLSASDKALTTVGTAFSIVHFAIGNKTFLYACFSLSPQAFNRFLNPSVKRSTACATGLMSRSSSHSRRSADISSSSPVISSTMPNMLSQIFLPVSFFSQASLILVLRVSV